MSLNKIKQNKEAIKITEGMNQLAGVGAGAGAGLVLTTMGTIMKVIKHAITNPINIFILQFRQYIMRSS